MEIVIQQFKSWAYWLCPICGHENAQNIVVPELNFSGERSSEMSVSGDTNIVCDKCGTEHKGEVWVHPDHTSFQMESPEEFSFVGDMPFYDPPEEDYAPAEDPDAVAREALRQLEAMVGVDGARNDPQFKNRLVFIGAISSMEAYLGDSLVNAVRRDKVVRDRLVGNNAKLGGVSVTAAELSKNPDALIEAIVRELRKVLYHNLSVVAALYKDAFAIDLTTSDAESGVLFPAMKLRHHCVHRNGRDESGAKLDDFTDDYVRSVIATIGAMITHIENRGAPSPF